MVIIRPNSDGINKTQLWFWKTTNLG